jgi:hypothetical protein
MSMSRLQAELEGTLHDHEIQTHLENIAEDVLQLTVRQHLQRSMLIIERPHHRPFEVTVEVDYHHKPTETTAVRTRKIKTDSNKQGIFGSTYRWLWYVILFGGAIITLLSNIFSDLIRSSLAPIFGEFSTSDLLLIVLLVFGLSFVFAYFGISFITNQQHKRLEQFDHRVFSIISARIHELEQDLSAQVSRCWSCFKELDSDGEYCPHCGEAQA